MLLRSRRLLPGCPRRRLRRQNPSKSSSGPFGSGTRNQFSNMRRSTTGTPTAIAATMRPAVAAEPAHEDGDQQRRRDVDADARNQRAHRSRSGSPPTAPAAAGPIRRTARSCGRPRRTRTKIDDARPMTISDRHRTERSRRADLRRPSRCRPAGCRRSRSAPNTRDQHRDADLDRPVGRPGGRRAAIFAHRRSSELTIAPADGIDSAGRYARRAQLAGEEARFLHQRLDGASLRCRPTWRSRRRS